MSPRLLNKRERARRWVGGTNSNGVPDEGTIDVFNAGLPAPKPAILRFTPASGHVGAKVTISQGPYTGATVVKSNGRNATFKVKGSEFITATGPAGATTRILFSPPMRRFARAFRSLVQLEFHLDLLPQSAKNWLL